MDSPNWTNMFVNFSGLKVTSAQTDNCYALTPGGDIYYYIGNLNNWSMISAPTTNPIVSIEASVDGSLVALDNNDNAYLYSYGSWSTVHSSALNVSVGDANHYVVTDTSTAIIKYSYGSPSTISGGPTKISATSGLGNIWGVDGLGNVVKRSGNFWITVSGQTLKEIDVSLSSSNSLQVCGVDANGDGWVYNGTYWFPVVRPSGVSFSTKFTSLSAGANNIWATFSNGNVYRGVFY